MRHGGSINHKKSHPKVALLLETTSGRTQRGSPTTNYWAIEGVTNAKASTTSRKRARCSFLVLYERRPKVALIQQVTAINVTT